MKKGLVLTCLIVACAHATRTKAGDPRSADLRERTATILAINDVYRIEGLDEGAAGGMARVRALRRELEAKAPDLLMLHAGDFLFPSFASRTFRGEQMVAAMNMLDGDGNAFDDRMFVVFGNHEFERNKLADAAFLKGRIEMSQFRWLGGNVTFKKEAGGQPLVSAKNLSRSAIVTSGGLKVGIFGLTIPTVGVAYIDGFDGEQAAAKELTAALRAEGADVVIALTHLLARDDRAILEKLGASGPDLIIGGHDHEAAADEVAGRWFLKADADARTARVIRITKRANGSLAVTHELRKLAGDSPAPDASMQRLVDDWQTRHSHAFCAAAKAGPACLDEIYGRTQTELTAEENKIRGSETSLGDWIADRMIDAFKTCGAQTAFINSGSLRLNRDLRAGTTITRRHIEELFAYPTPLFMIRIDGSTLAKVADQSVRGWPGAGSWLQIGGFAFRHDPLARAASNVAWISEGPRRPVAPSDSVLAVTGDFVLNPGAGDQDGYLMLNQSQIVKECALNDGRLDLKDLVVRELKAAEPRGIAPKIEGRICRGDTKPCLAAAR